VIAHPRRAPPTRSHRASGPDRAQAPPPLPRSLRHQISSAAMSDPTSATSKKPDAKQPTKKASAKKSAGRRAKKDMTAEHKSALRAGRFQADTVRRYLNAIQATGRPRRRSPEVLQARLTKVNASYEQAGVLDKLLLAQERLNLEAEMDDSRAADGLADLEAAFVQVASEYGQRKGISYDAWRQVGVQASTLKRAGITRAR
jgi:hypothetical protein